MKLGVEVETRQAPQEHELWQDSVVLCWWDLEAGVGGFHRIGHQPLHPDGPCAHLSSAFFGTDRVFKRNESLPLRDVDQPASGGFGCGDGTCAYEFTDHPVWTFDQEEARGELHVRDFHTPVDLYPKSGELAARLASGHLEAGGGIRGRLTFAGREYEIDGLAFRDRGWGLRYWETLLAHRWVAATFGHEATALAVSVLTSDGRIADFGGVIRGDEVTPAAEVDFLTYVERDGLTHRGGHVHMVLADGEVVELDAEPLQKGAVSWMANKAALTDTICKVTWGDRVGICCYETTNNYAAGKTKPVFAINGIIEDGMHRASPRRRDRLLTSIGD